MKKRIQILLIMITILSLFSVSFYLYASSEESESTVEETQEEIETETFTEGDSQEQIESEEESFAETEPGIEEETNRDVGVDVSNQEVVVETAEALDYHLRNNSGKNIIYLGADITIPQAGIPVNLSKGDFIIDGTNPLTGVRHSLRDTESSDLSRSIYIRDNHTSRNITVRNINIIGRNFYGTIGYTDTASVNSVLTYQNVSYTGPQMALVKFGTLEMDNVKAVIEAGYSPANEVAELSILKMKNKVEITQIGTNPNAIFLFRRSNAVVIPLLRIEENAEVTINPANRSGNMVYDETGALQLSFGIKSRFEYNGLDSFWRNDYPRGMRVEREAYVKISSTDTLSRGLLSIGGDLTVEEGATLRVENRTANTSYALRVDGGNVSFRDPERVVIYSQSGVPFFMGTAQNTLSISARQINYWNKASDGGVEENTIPTYSWMKKDGGMLEMTGTAGGGGGVSSVVSNYIAQGDERDTATNLLDNSVYQPLDANRFQMLQARMLSFGRFEIIYPYYSDEERSVKGQVTALADILGQVYEDQEDSYETLYSGRANDTGVFAFSLEDAVDPMYVYAQSHYQYLYSRKIPVVEGGLSLSAPPAISFRTQELTGKEEVIFRQGESARMEVTVSDERTINRGGWVLSVKAGGFKRVGIEDELVGTVLFADQAGNYHELENGYMIESSGTGGDKTFLWEEEEGILARINTNSVYADVLYTTTIVWTLSDVP